MRVLDATLMSVLDASLMRVLDASLMRVLDDTLLRDLEVIIILCRKIAISPELNIRWTSDQSVNSSLSVVVQ